MLNAQYLISNVQLTVERRDSVLRSFSVGGKKQPREMQRGAFPKMVCSSTGRFESHQTNHEWIAKYQRMNSATRKQDISQYSLQKVLWQNGYAPG